MPWRKQKSNLEQLVYGALKDYFDLHEGSLPAPGLYDRVISEVERPLLFLTLQVVNGNQQKAARILGLSRNTLRKKMTELMQNRSSLDKLKNLQSKLET
ncbi:MAG: Fis family transcriptional regulator [Holosporales bacterium]|jgi:two-component system nitrogen regulation response regulator GlnG|nr:Fis family transcriptional regulator [Holosporales bacterium]